MEGKVNDLANRSFKWPSGIKLTDPDELIQILYLAAQSNVTKESIINMNKIKYAIIGSGTMGQEHINNINSLIMLKLLLFV